MSETINIDSEFFELLVKEFKEKLHSELSLEELKIIQMLALE